MSTPDVVTLTLPDDATAARQARGVVKESLDGWGLGVLVDDAQLAVSELVTNALRHGLPPVVLTLRRSPALLRIDVSDMRPSTAHAELVVVRHVDDESGRGRGIIDQVSDDSGVDRVDDDASKSVYVSWDTLA